MMLYYIYNLICRRITLGIRPKSLYRITVNDSTTIKRKKDNSSLTRDTKAYDLFTSCMFFSVIQTITGGNHEKVFSV